MAIQISRHSSSSSISSGIMLENHTSSPNSPLHSVEHPPVDPFVLNPEISTHKQSPVINNRSQSADITKQVVVNWSNNILSNARTVSALNHGKPATSPSKNSPQNHSPKGIKASYAAFPNLNNTPKMKVNQPIAKKVEQKEKTPLSSKPSGWDEAAALKEQALAATLFQWIRSGSQQENTKAPVQNLEIKDDREGLKTTAQNDKKTWWDEMAARKNREFIAKYPHLAPKSKQGPHTSNV